MTYEIDNSSFKDIFAIINQQGMSGMADAMQILLNEAMKIERSQYLGAEHYERNLQRTGYANGYKPKTVKTRIGELPVDVPQTRDGGFYPSCLEKGLRSEQALNLALAEMYVNGVSTRKVSAVVEKMCGMSVSSQMVSKVAIRLDEAFEKWRTRPLGRIKYLFLDARYESVRVDSLVRDCAVLIAVGIDGDGKRDILGVSVDLSEAEVHWRNFLKSLVKRGLNGVEMIISDAHAGLGAARKSVLPSVPW